MSLSGQRLGERPADAQAEGPLGGNRLRLAAALLLAAAAGVAAAASAALAAGLLVLTALLYAFARSAYKNEIVVGVYWVSYCVYETILTGVSISGFFYPFYLYFLWAIVAKLASGGLRLHLPTILIYALFMVMVLVSFVGFMNPVGFEVIQRLVAYLLGFAVAAQLGSVRGLYAAAYGFVAGSVVVAVWVIDESVESGFAYRAGIEVNQNDLSAVIALGLIPAVVLLIGQLLGPGRRWWAFLASLAATGVMLYGLALLASRGMSISVILAVLVICARVVSRRPRALLAFVLVVLASASVLLLPGGDSIIERFDERNVTTANERSGLWSATWHGYTGGGFYELLAGWGFDSNKELLRREFGWTTSTHNAYLQILYEFGVVGLLTFLALLLYLWRLGWRADGAIGLVLLGLATFLLGANLSSNGPDGFVFWITLGYLLGVANWLGGRPRVEREDQAPDTSWLPETHARGAS